MSEFDKYFQLVMEVFDFFILLLLFLLFWTSDLFLLSFCLHFYLIACSLNYISLCSLVHFISCFILKEFFSSSNVEIKRVFVFDSALLVCLSLFFVYSACSLLFCTSLAAIISRLGSCLDFALQDFFKFICKICLKLLQRSLFTLLKLFCSYICLQLCPKSAYPSKTVAIPINKYCFSEVLMNCLVIFPAL